MKTPHYQINEQPSNPKETVSQEQKINLENLKRIINSKKTTLPSLRNIEWRILKIETNKINQVLPYMSTKNINELNELNLGVCSVCEKTGIASKNTKKKSKPGGKTRLEAHIKNLQKHAKMIKQKKDARICWNRREMATREK